MSRSDARWDAGSRPTAPQFVLSGVGLRLGLHLALSRMDLAIRPGERVALVGPNGSGKSTLLRVLHGLLAPSEGTCLAPPAAQQAMVFQRPHLLRTSSLNNVALGLCLRGLGWRAARAQAREALCRVGLDAVAHQRATTLSGGQMQRVALARAWALQPEVLLLDEPTASLDPQASREVEALLQAWVEGEGPSPTRFPRTLVFSSHSLAQVQRLAQRVVCLDQGRIVADLPVHDFFHGPLPERAAHFLQGDMPWPF